MGCWCAYTNAPTINPSSHQNLALERLLASRRKTTARVESVVIVMNTPRISVARLSLSDGRAVVQRVLAKARTSGTYGELAKHAFKVTNVTRTCKTNCPCLIYHKLARSSLVVDSRMHRWCIHMKNQIHSHLPQGP